jgi:hypothetical protein
MSLYIKNKKNEFIPVDISSVMSKDLNNRLVIVKVGTEERQATLDDLDLTTSSFAKADVLDDLDNVSIIITPYQIDIDLIDERDVEDKTICVQITGGDDINMLDDAMRAIYKKLKKNYSETTILPTPLRIKDYLQVKDTLKRCKMRKKRRFRIS